MGLKTPKWLTKIGSLLKELPTTILKPLIRKGEQYIEEAECDDKNDMSKDSAKNKND